MCECGCGEMTAPVVWFDGPPGLNYGLALYGGCRDCGNPAWFTVYQIPDAEMQHFVMTGETPQPVKWVQLAGWKEFSVPVGPTKHPTETHHRIARRGFDAFLKEQAGR